MGRDAVFLSVLVVAALVVWAILAARTQPRGYPLPEPTDHEVHIVCQGDLDDGTLAAMCGGCEWSEVSTERDMSAQEHDLRAKARRHARKVASQILVLDPEPADERWSPERLYTYPTEVIHDGRNWKAKWLNRDEEPGVSQAWDEVTP
ncbi:MAG TPA: hypothetical protein VF062_15025 [Candidatus Limnocylindrales bacterium]